MRRFRAAAIVLLVVARSGVVGAEEPGPDTGGRAAGAHDFSQLPDPERDSDPPPVLPDRPGGLYGYSRYVFWELDGEVVPALVEGPRGAQIRCQQWERDCSYLELKALHESGAEPPAELGMTREELGTLVGQLDALSAKLTSYANLDVMCAEGYRVSSQQAPNMGIHMLHFGYVTDGAFDPTKPEMLLVAMPEGLWLPKQQLGDCVDGKWTGDPRQKIVGAAYVLATQLHGEEHPEGFAGPIDNWHIHYNTCTEARNDVQLTREECEAIGGSLVPKAGWMIHAYAHPEFDSQAGVFNMWNPAIWPVVAEGAGTPEAAPAQGAAQAAIREFAYEPIEVAVSEQVTITNRDAFPHTVTDGDPGESKGRFDSGVLQPGDSITLSFDEPGEYPLHCTLHPFMVGTVSVTEK